MIERHSVERSPQIDWGLGRVCLSSLRDSDGRSSAHRWSLAICGDWAPGPEQQKAIADDPERFYGALLPILRSADLAVVNVECVLSDDELQPRVKDGITMQLPARSVAGLSVVPFHLACMANNHTFDFGPEGFSGTRALLARHSIQSIGGGMDADATEAPTHFRFGETRVVILNVAEEVCTRDGGAGVASLDVSRVCAQLEALRVDADVAIVVIHAGREHLPVPPPHLQTIYRTLVDAGADLVVGHHPHVPQGLEIYRQAPIFYSLGNFVLWRGFPVRLHQLGYVVIAEFAGSDLETVSVLPYRIHSDHLALLDGEDLEGFREEFRALSLYLADREALGEIWAAYVDRWLVSQGIQQLADSAAIIGGSRLSLRSALRASLDRFQGESLINRFATRTMWSLIRMLNHRSGRVPVISPRLTSPGSKKAASILHNRFDTFTHRELYLEGLDRVIAGSVGTAPEWAYGQLDEWDVFWYVGRGWIS